MTLILTCLVSSSWAWAEPSAADSSDANYVKTPTAKEYPHSSILYVRDEIAVTVDTTGKMAIDELAALKALDESGVKYLQEQEFISEPNTTIELVSARWIDPQGKENIINVDTIHLEEAFQEALYKDYKLLKIKFPITEPNSVIEYRLRRIEAKRDSGFWNTSSFFSNYFPMLGSLFVLHVPDSVLPNWHAYPPLGVEKPTITHKDGVTTYTWNTSASDAMTMEPKAPTGLLKSKRVDITNCPSWEQYCQKYYAMWQEKKSSLGSKADEISSVCLKQANVADPLPVKARAILRYLAMEYGSLELNSGWDLHAPAESFNASKLCDGDLLLLASVLLDRIGVDNRLVLTSTLPDEELLSMCPVNTNLTGMLLELPRIGKSSLWVCPDSIGVLMEAPDDYYQAVSAIALIPRLDASDKCDVQFFITPEISAEDNILTNNLEVNVTPFGYADVVAQVQCQGTVANSLRHIEAYLSVFPEISKQLIVKYLMGQLDLVYGSKVSHSSHYLPEKTDPDKPYSYETSFLYPGLAKRNAQTKTYSMPLDLYNSNSLSVVPRKNIAGSTETAKEDAKTDENVGRQRTSPIFNGSPGTSEYRLHAILPKEAKIIALPANVSVQNAVGSYYAAFKHDKNEVWAYVRVRLNHSWVPLKDFALYQELEQAQRQVADTSLVYEYTPPQPSSIKSEVIVEP